MIFNMGGYENIKGKLPEFTYTGTWKWTEQVKNGTVMNWQLDLLTSGKLTFTKVIDEVDIFVLGAGGSGANAGDTSVHVGGTAVGGGGYYKTVEDVAVEKKVTYDIVIGAAGDASGEAGGSSSAFGTTANGGTAGKVGSTTYATYTNCYSPSGTAGNIYSYNSLSDSGSSLGSGYMNLDLKYPLETAHHTDGRTVYVGKSGYYYCNPGTVYKIYHNSGTNGTGGSSTKVFSTGDAVSGPGATANATKLGQGGGTSGIVGGNGLVSIRNPR